MFIPGPKHTHELSEQKENLSRKAMYIYHSKSFHPSHPNPPILPPPTPSWVHLVNMHLYCTIPSLIYLCIFCTNLCMVKEFVHDKRSLSLAMFISTSNEHIVIRTVQWLSKLSYKDVSPVVILLMRSLF
jgi:hypothetical protein